ncbi:hypothetical protein FMM08_03145 [Quadrisphaera setariae]|uniref:GtrA/DPMS transmembrane domain-containing protein n=2 Tax=Quadrisphaera setariae TaxID=2593304 RepID=A0A5C8ZHH7_9ACTN|nr:GtrA family protein [Quadrisphaera setariae]TXR57287.1 hypothetical protein FMM08_03145 [Quadrisphaera setariae]
MMTERPTRRDLLALLKFVTAGCAGNLVYSLVFLLVAQGDDGVVASSVVASVVSTVAVNEAHRRWTFRSIGRPSLRQAHLSGAASAVAGTVLTATAVSAWTWLAPSAPLTSDVAISWGVTALVGSANFLHLRRASAGATAGPSRGSAEHGARGVAARLGRALTPAGPRGSR